MRDYGKVHTRFWSSETTRSLSDDGRMLALYLLTSPHSTIAGVFPLPDGYICEDMQWTAERVAKGFSELLANGFAGRCIVTKWVWVHEHLKWNPPENPNQRKAAAKVAQTIPAKATWRAEFMRIVGPQLGLEAPPAPSPAPKGNGRPTVPELFPNQKQEQTEQKQEGSSAPQADAEPPSGFAVPLIDGTEWLVPRASLREWHQAFPAVDVEQELREMRVWSLANRENRKTARGVERFVVKWLQKAQDTPGRARKQGGGSGGGDWTGAAT